MISGLISTWGLPLAVLLAGIGGGIFVASSSRTDTADIARSRRTDASQDYAASLQALKALEQQQGKHSTDEYSRQRDELMQRAKDALRRLEDPSMTHPDPIERVRQHLESQRATLGDEAVEAALRRLAARAPRSATANPTISPAWMGALYTLIGLTVVAGLAWFVGGQSFEREPGGIMTGADPNELLGGVALERQEAPTGQLPPAQVPPEVIALQERVAADPNDVEARNGLTEFAIGSQDLAEAMAQNGEVLQIDPSNSDGRVYRAYLMMSIGRTTEAIGQLEELLVEEPNNIKASIYYGLMTLTANEPDKAIPALERAIATNPAGVEFLRERLEAAKAMAGQAPDAAEPMSLSRIAGGQLRLDDELLGLVQPGDTLFVSVRDPAGGPPLAAQRLEPGPFPMAFDITTADVIQMGGSRPLPPLVDVSFRIDRDGNAMSREEGLPAATVRGVSVGAEELFVELIVTP